MFSTRREIPKPARAATDLSDQAWAVVQRMRIRSLNDPDIATLMDELSPYLPPTAHGKPDGKNPDHPA